MNYLKYILTFCWIYTSCTKSENANIISKFPLEYVSVIGSNGIIEHDNLLWMADLIGSQIIAFDFNGSIKVTYTKKYLTTGPDDLCFIDDTTFVWTSFLTGEVKMTTYSGKTSTIAQNIPTVNPIVAIPNERCVLVAPSVGTAVSLLKINVDNMNIDTIVSNIDGINGFDLQQNILIAPVFNTDAILGNGKLLRIDIVQKTKSYIQPEFLNEPNKRGFNSPTGVCYGKNGLVYILEAFGGVAVYEYNPNNNIAKKIYKSNILIADNICMANDGYIYVSTFVGNKIIKITPSGNSSVFFVAN